MDLLKREHAPILPDAWTLIDEEAKRVLASQLAGRKLVDFDGPHGWGLAAVNTGRVTSVEAVRAPDLVARIRRVAPLVELTAPIVLELKELDAVGRGGDDPDLSAVVGASERVARFEDDAIFNGNAEAGITGIIPASPHATINVPSVDAWPSAVAKAKEILKAAGIGGPYALAAGRTAYDELAAGSEDGYPLRKHVEQQLSEGSVVWAPTVNGAVLLSIRGNDYRLSVGQDLSIGYSYQERDTVSLFLTESFTFRVLERAAAVRLVRV